MLMPFGMIIAIAALMFMLAEGALYLRRRQRRTNSERVLFRAKQEVQEIAQLPLNNPYPLFQISRDGKVVFVNPAAIKTFPDLNEKGSKHEIFNGFESFFDITESLMREVPIGSNVYHQTITPGHSNGEDVLIIYCLDITEQKKYEKELKEAHRLTEKSRQAEKEAKEARGAFLANMSHELRTPMNGIIGLSDILVEGGLDGEKQEMINAVNSSARNLLILLNDILDFSKIEAGELSMEAIPFDIRKIITQVESLQSPMAQQKGLRMSSHVSDAVPKYLVGDPSRLQQILNNLISNALKFTDHGSVTISVSGQLDDQGNCVTKISVTDTGIGIPKEKQASVFEKFQQADASTARKYGGTGLGLSITKDLAELMNGSMSIESEEGVGTTFTATIITPVAKAGGGSPDDVVCETQQNGINMNASVMIVDDHPINLLFMRKVLTQLGFEGFAEAASGKKAVDLFKEKPYDVILMDCQMPEMDGFEAARAIREIETAENEPTIIAVTADAMKGAEDKCIAAGMDDYISKPVEKDKLYGLLKKWIPGNHRELSEDDKDSKDSQNLTQQGQSIVFDWARLKEFTGDDPEVENQIIEIFVENLDNDIRSLSNSFKNKDYKSWDEWAHKLFGACAHIGANAMASICDEAQSLSTDDENIIETLHLDILKQYDLVQQALREKANQAA